MARSEKLRNTNSASTSLRIANFVQRQVVDTWRRAGDIKAGWSELERQQRALVGEVKRNQIIELCFGTQGLVNCRPVRRQRIGEW
jgi:hypothetical protein